MGAVLHAAASACVEGLRGRARPGPRADRHLVPVAEGEFAVLSGASGAGKTTLLRLLYRDERPVGRRDRGRRLRRRPRCAGREMPRLRRAIGVVFQDAKLLAGRTVFENMAFVLRVARHARAARSRPARSHASRPSASRARAQAYPHQLSQGEAQRAALARAIAKSPGAPDRRRAHRQPRRRHGGGDPRPAQGHLDAGHHRAPRHPPGALAAQLKRRTLVLEAGGSSRTRAERVLGFFVRARRCAISAGPGGRRERRAPHRVVAGRARRVLALLANLGRAIDAVARARARDRLPQGGAAGRRSWTTSRARSRGSAASSGSATSRRPRRSSRSGVARAPGRRDGPAPRIRCPRRSRSPRIRPPRRRRARARSPGTWPSSPRSTTCRAARSGSRDWRTSSASSSSSGWAWGGAGPGGDPDRDHRDHARAAPAPRGDGDHAAGRRHRDRHPPAPRAPGDGPGAGRPRSWPSSCSRSRSPWSRRGSSRSCRSRSASSGRSSLGAPDARAHRRRAPRSARRRPARAGRAARLDAARLVAIAVGLPALVPRPAAARSRRDSRARAGATSSTISSRRRSDSARSEPRRPTRASARRVCWPSWRHRQAARREAPAGGGARRPHPTRPGRHRRAQGRHRPAPEPAHRARRRRWRAGSARSTSSRRRAGCCRSCSPATTPSPGPRSFAISRPWPRWTPG